MHVLQIMEWQAAEQALASAQNQLARENHILNRNTGSSQSTIRKRQTTSILNDLSPKRLDTHFKENVDNKVQPTYRRSFGWSPDEEEPLSAPFLPQEKTHTASPVRSREQAKNTAEKKRRDTPAPTRTSHRQRLHVLDRAVERKLLRRARASVKELEWKLSQPSLPRHSLSITEDLCNSIILYNPNDVIKVLCCGCMARLAVGSQELLETWRPQLRQMVGNIIPKSDRQSGGTITEETSV